MGTTGLQTSFDALSLTLDVPISAQPQAASQNRNFWIWGYRWCEPLADSLAAAAAIQFVTFGASFRHASPEIFHDTQHLGSTLFFMLMVTVLFKLMGAYRPARSMLSVRETADAIAVSCSTAALLMLFSAADLIQISSLRALGLSAVLFLLLLLEKHWISSLMMRFHERGIGVTRVALCGSGIACKRLYTTLVNSPKLGLWPAVVINPSATGSEHEIRESGYRIRRSAAVIAQKPCFETLRRSGVTRVLLIASSFDPGEMHHMLSQASRLGLQVQICGNDLATANTSWQCADADGATLWGTAKGVTSQPYESIKRAFDIAAALVLLIGLSPLLAVIAIAIRLTSPGDIVFRQVRVGRRNRRFTMLKFRSMHAKACGDGFSPTSKTDCRITPVGRILRKTSLDELPQLFNVLRGEMSLVGPRPEMRFIVDGYTPMQARRLEVVPGITGLWQLSADRRDLIHNNVEYDLYYLTHRSLSLDAAILLHTLAFAMRGI